FWLNASDRLCAGSVLIRRTDSRALASWMAREQDVVVLPTPPLPPTKIQRRDFWSMMDWSVGSMGGSSSRSAMVVMRGVYGVSKAKNESAGGKRDAEGSWCSKKV